MKKFYSQALTVAILLLYTLMTACSTSNSEKDDLLLQPVNSIKVGDYTVKLSGEFLPEAGDNLLFWQVEEGSSEVKLESVEITPVMDMGSTSHASPYETPAVFEGNDKVFAGNVIFTMPSGEMGGWTIGFNIKTESGDIIEGELEVEVASSWRITSVRDSNDEVYFITWSRPKNPVVGLNPLHFLLHKKDTMMHFPALEGAEVIVYPFMDMGGGEGHSTQYTDPAEKGHGLYEGSINYSMSGTWTTTVTLVIGEETLPPAEFEYSVRAK